MSNWAIIYVKITDDKKEGIQMQGPTVGPVKDTKALAESEAKKLINESRNCTVIPRIYEIHTILGVEAALIDARQFYKRMLDNMLEAKEALARPIHRKRRRKAKPASAIKDEKAYGLDPE